MKGASPRRDATPPLGSRVTAAVELDLSDCKPDAQRHRLDCLRRTPTNARAVIHVGAATVEPSAVRFIQEHADRLDIEFHGQLDAVRNWLEATRCSDQLEWFR